MSAEHFVRHGAGLIGCVRLALEWRLDAFQALFWARALPRWTLVLVGVPRGEYFAPPVMTAGIAAVDVDGDGWIDFFVPCAEGKPDLCT